MTSSRFPKRGDPAETLGRVEAFSAAPGRQVSGQHVVSKALLKRFAAPVGATAQTKIGVYNIQHHSTSERVGPDGAGKVQDFIGAGSASAEQLWKTYENRLQDVIDSAHNGTLHQRADLLTIARAIIALHFIRSRHYRETHRQAVKAAATIVLRETTRRHQRLVEAEFYRTYGLHAGGQEGLRLIVQRHIDEKWLRPEGDGSFFRDSVEQQFLRFNTAFQTQEIQVLRVPAGGELLISDTPCVSPLIGADGTVLATHAPLAESAPRLMLPVAPDCALSLVPAQSVYEMTNVEVDIFNRVQVLAAREHVFYRPGSGLSAFITESFEQQG